MKKIFVFCCLLLAAVTAGAGELRIVSLGPYVTENLFLLGLGENIAGLTVHDRSEHKKGKEIIGTLLAPNIEKIMALQPDIVIGSKEGNRQESVQKIEQLGITTLTLGELHTFEQLCDNLLLLGKNLGRREKAEKIVYEQKKRLDKISDMTAEEKQKKRILFILGFRPVFTAGTRTYINEMIQRAGGINIFSDVHKKWFSCSIEEILRRNPEKIVFLKMEDEETLLWDILRDVDAVKNKQIWGVEPSIIGSPTPETFADSVEYLYKLMYPVPKLKYQKMLSEEKRPNTGRENEN